VTCFKTRERQLDGTLLARWDAAYAEPWLILTDLPPSQADAIWYGLRAWIAGGSKDATRGGWHWEQTKMTDPARAERGWLAMALATLWVVRVGCAAEGAHPAPAAAASSRDIFGCSKNRQNRIVENSTYPLDDFGFR